MKGRRLLALSVLSIALACDDRGSPTEPRGLTAPTGPAGAISDGAHGGNPDFFFLPPMVSNPVGNQNFESGRFNAALGSRLTIEICRLQAAPIDANGNPVATDCATNVPLVKKFAAGTIRTQGSGADGHYHAQWNTRESNLDVTKYYRIKVLIEGSTTALGFADIDPMDNKGQLKNARTGEVIALIDDSTLPIKFRVENSALCNAGETLCTSTTVTNHTPNGEPQIVRIVGADGSAIAGVLIPDGFLPPDGPQSVVLTIDRVNTGVNNIAAGTQSIPCHANLPLQQFNSCFHFSTIPELATINEEGHQFLKALTVAVCFVLHDLEDPREPWVQLWSSEEGGEDTKPLPGASATRILAGDAGETCGDDLTASTTPSNGFARFASAGWKKVKGGLGQLFGVKTAYAIDLGLGGLTFDFSNIGPAMTAQIQRYTNTDLTLGSGATTTSTARIVGTRVHNGGPLTTGIGGLPVTFTVAANNGSLRLIGSEAPGALQVTSITNTNPINSESPTSGGGFAPVNWTLPTAPGTYTLTANGPATGGPVTFTATVTGALPNPILEFTGFEAGGESVTYNLNVSNFAAYPAEMFVAAPTLPPCGLNTSASRTWVDIYNAANDNRIYGFCGLGSPSGLQSIWFGWPTGTAPPAQVYITLIDRQTGVTYRSNNVAVTGPPVVGFNFLQGSLTAGAEHTCGLTIGGAAYCWGYNEGGLLGDGTASNRSSPAAVTGGLAFATLAAGNIHTCGLTSGGAAHCWGFNGSGELGDGTTISRRTPVPVAGDITFASLAAGGYRHGCGVTNGGAAYCWGENDHGALGDGTTTSRVTPVAVVGEIAFASLTLGALHTCGLTSGGVPYCWGLNRFGQLGDGTLTSSTTPVAVAGEFTFVRLTAGYEHTCGLTSSGVTYCWGQNFFGGLGDGTTTDHATPAVAAAGLTFTTLSAGWYHTCGVTSGGTAYCWGYNLYGNLGDGSETHRTTPVVVAGGLTFAMLTAGTGHTCGLTRGGAAYCWGRNGFSQLGDGGTTDRATPVAVVSP